MNLNDIVSSLQDLLEDYLDFEWSSTSSGVKPSKEFSAMNPIDVIAREARRVKDAVYLCMIEACSGSGKSLCAADFFVRNSKDCMYFLFNPSQQVSKQSIYQCVTSITNLMSMAINSDLCLLTMASVPESSTELLTAIDFDVKTSGRKWHVLGTLGYLWNETNSVAPVSVEEAMKWRRRWVLIDETIPPDSHKAYLFSQSAKLVLFKRILTNAKIHCIMLGTNTLVMNFNQISKSSDYSRNEKRRMFCFTHRSLPRYVPSSSKDKEILEKVFGQTHVPVLLDNVNPWLCSLFLNRLKDESETEPSLWIRKTSSMVLEEVKMEKPSLRDESIYCMFQVAAHQPVSQLQISKGFAQLNVWKGNVPPRGSRQAIVSIVKSSKAEDLRIKGTSLSLLTSRFTSPVHDPITMAICAGQGRPFSDRSALEVLQTIHEEMASGNDPISVDAFKRDPNVLESFGAVVMMISSWSLPQDLLSNIAYHCGITDERQVEQILAAVPSKQGFMQILASCMSNLVPVRLGEENELAGVLGFYTRNRDRDRRDGTFAGPRSAHLKGGTECKNWSSPLSSTQLSSAISGLLERNFDIIVCMVPGITENALEGCVRTMSRKTEWLVLHLTDTGWTASSFGADASEDMNASKDEKVVDSQDKTDAVKQQILMVIEIGTKTPPFSGGRM